MWASTGSLLCSAEAAEIKALIWAMSMANDREWNEVVWRSDIKVVVKPALSKESLGWNTGNDYLLLHRNLSNSKWSLDWVGRELNGSIDVTAKLALRSSRDFLFYYVNLLSMPAEIML